MTIQDLMHSLTEKTPNTDIFSISYTCAQKDYEELCDFIMVGYNPDAIYWEIRSERRRLQHLMRIKTVLKTIDRLLKTGFEYKMRSEEIRSAEEKLIRFSMMRDFGADASALMIGAEIPEWSDVLKGMERDFQQNLIESPALFLRIAQQFLRTDEEEPFLSLYSYIREFISVCPEKYLENGVFGKFMRSIFGVFAYSKRSGKTNYHDIARLSGYFATTYLYDDIIDDPMYNQTEKDLYARNVFSILESEDVTCPHYSDDPLMAFSEAAFSGIRMILDEERARMVSRSYLAIARATYIGSQWAPSDTLTGVELYSIATIKAAYTRIIPAILAGYTIDDVFLSFCMRAGLIYQLTDDLRDITDDLHNLTITPFTYYYLNQTDPKIHPISLFLAAISRISDENLLAIPDARRLWIMRLTHSIRQLTLKNKGNNTQGFLLDMKFPMNCCLKELELIAACSDLIVDIEAEAAKAFSDCAVMLRCGCSNASVYGH